MIVIDTHIWIWWVHGHVEIKPWMRELLLKHESTARIYACELLTADQKILNYAGVKSAKALE